ncbi:hypothetical protein E1263_03415 [Kribbella antibiotica]|uniref:DUF2238 domain-containing protein n=1 Tax=Kribbella antibiotica TaxID=190195 RepID=A0A4R4ZVH5_9ACTN|nr:hypothetical protein [Kribbella antibiotica]TDD62500.1 hypothetical protein E1263_03415 [Kribbella antibiotica]
MTTMVAPPTAPDTRTSRVRYAALIAKVLLFALLLTALIWPDLSGIKGKASGARLVVYPLGAMVLPLWWWAYGRTRSKLHHAFPWPADLLLTLPWLIDLLGNRLNLFDTVTWWDDAMHFVLWGFLTAGALLAFAPRNLSLAVTAFVALGFGTTAAVIWELGEYVAFVRHSPELQSAYTDTLGDLALGTLGALLAGLLLHRLAFRPKAN